MELNGALNETVGIMDGLIAGLTSEHREMKTPCKQFTVHDLMNHVVNTSKFVSAVVAGTPENMPAEGTDHLTEGPVNGWNDGKAAGETSEDLVPAPAPSSDNNRRQKSRPRRRPGSASRPDPARWPSPNASTSRSTAIVWRSATSRRCCTRWSPSRRHR